MNGPGDGYRRRALVENVAERLLAPDSFGVVVYGDTGMGKSTVAENVLGKLQDRFRVQRIRAERSLAGTEYGALFPFLTGLGAAELESPLAVLKAVRSSLVPENAQHPLLLVVDDLHDLDDASSYLMEQLLMTGTVKVLALCRSWGSQPQEFRSLTQDGLLEAIELLPLTRDEVRRIAEELVGGAVAGGTVLLLEQKSRGNPQLLSSLVNAGLAAGDLALVNGIWSVQREPTSVDPAVADLVKGMVKELDSRQRRALEMLALAGGLPTAAAQYVLDSSVLQSLEELSLVARRQEPGREPVQDVLRLQYPPYEDVVRAMVPAGRSAELLREVTEAVKQSRCPDRDGLGLRLARWALDAGRPPSQNDLLSAARRANCAADYPLALRLVAAMDSTGASPAAQVEKARACLGLGDRAGAGHALDLVGETVDLPTAAGAALVRAMMAQHRADRSTRVEVICRQWKAAPVESTESQAGAGSCLTPAAGTWLLSVQERILDGDYGQALASLQASPEGADNGAAEVLAGAARAACLAETRGSPALCQEAAETAMLSAAVPSLQAFYPFVFSRCTEALLVAGLYPQAERALQEFRERAPDRYRWFSGLEGALQGMLLVRQGNMNTGLPWLAEGVSHLRRNDPALLLPAALGAAAAAAAFLGREKAARCYRQELAELPYGSSRARQLVARAQASEVPALADLAREARSAGMVSAEQDILELQLLRGEMSGLERLAELTAGLGAPDSIALHAFAHSLQSAEAEALVDAAELAAGAGKHLLAATALSWAAGRYGDAGKRRQQQALLHRLRAAMPLVEGVATPAMRSVPDNRPLLTARERQIARLVSQGATNKQIAQALTLSTRTAEGHLYRIYLKLGVEKREDLIRHPELLDS